MDRIKYTPQGFSYVDVTVAECVKWGGYCICNSCNEICGDLKLIYVLGDTYCTKCFKEWVERNKNMKKEDIKHDLAYQNQNHIEWYGYHINLNK